MNGWNSGRRWRVVCAAVIPSACVLLKAAPAEADAFSNPATGTVFASPSQVHRQPAYADVTLGALYTDNVLRSAGAGGGDEIYSTGLALNLLRDGPALNYAANGNVQLLKYGSSAYGTNVLGYFDGNASYTFIPERFAWAAEESFTKVNTDPRAPTTLDTLGNFNYFTTGPRMQLPLADALTLAAGADYSKTSSQDLSNGPGAATNLDGSSYGGNVALIRSLSTATSVSLIADTKHVEFDIGAGSPTYEQTEGYARYQAKGARTFLTLDVGYTRLHETTGDKSGPLARLDLSRQLSPSSYVYLSAGRRFVGIGDSLRDAVATRGDDNTNTIATADPYTQSNAAAGWRFDRSRTHFGANGWWMKESHLSQSEFNRTRKGFDAYVERRLTPQLTLHVDGMYEREHFETDSFDTKQIDGIITLDWRFARRVSVAVRVERHQRSANTPAEGYTEDRYGFVFTYHAIGRK